FFSLEFVEGGSLDYKLNRKAQKPRDAAVLVEILARAMHTAHAKGIIHRDLKPANVLLTPEGMPKITDFGLAKDLGADSGKTHSGSVMGTPSYMAPEQAAGRVEDMGPATDVYALGAILYDALTGRPPFKGATVVDTLNQVRNDEPIPPSKLQPRTPHDLETICLKCLQKAPRKRYASALALAEDLHRYLNGEPILARPMGRAERLWRWCKRNPLAASLLVTVTLGSAFGMWYLSRLSQSLVHATALEGAAQQSETFSQMNTYYTTDVVDSASPQVATNVGYRTKTGTLPILGASTAGLLDSPLSQGAFLAASAAYPGRITAGTIPPPATLTIDFGDYLTGHSDRGTRVRLYSDYPFPHRTDGGVRDDFEQQALDHLRANPGEPYYRFEDQGGKPVLRYATARVMQEACVNCHNHNPDSPKMDWKVGDVRGVFEITRPLDNDERRTRQGLQGTFGVAGAVAAGLLVLSLLVLVVGNWRRRWSQSAAAQYHTVK
ncbi:MAG TPA: protein kinase, partial [Gemmataceae bacterium]|nr:protein kinase [Gemmataceae bacterium]